MLYKGKGRTSRGASRERELSRSAATSIREPGQSRRTGGRLNREIIPGRLPSPAPATRGAC